MRAGEFPGDIVAWCSSSRTNICNCSERCNHIHCSAR
jgi:hypothetical protein